MLQNDKGNYELFTILSVPQKKIKAFIWLPNVDPKNTTLQECLGKYLFNLNSFYDFSLLQ